MEKKTYCMPEITICDVISQDFLLASGDLDFDVGDLLQNRDSFSQSF